MLVILYKSKHGATKKIAKVIDTYLDHQCLLMDYEQLDRDILKSASSIVIGIPVYYSKLDSQMVTFIKNNIELLKEKNFSIYVTALFFSEFMHYLTEAFDYDILRYTCTLAGLGGALYYPELSVSERMALTMLNRRYPIIEKDRNDVIFENFDNQEIELFSKKIKKINEQSL